MKKIIFLIINLCVLSFFISCSARYIEVNSLSYEKEAFKGDTVTFSWSISNADYVRIDGFENKFKINDNLTIVADSSAYFRLTAYHGKRDSISRNINLIIKQSEAISGIDYSNNNELISNESSELSDFLNGIRNFTKDSDISKIRITGIFKEPENSDHYKVKFILLDDYGNFIDKVDLNKNNLQLSLSQTYGADKFTHIYNKIIRVEHKPSDVCILLDNSISASNNTELISEIDKFFASLTNESNVMFSVFNQNYENILRLSSKNNAGAKLKDLRLVPNGLSSLYDATYQALTDLSQSKNESKMLIVILHNSDNSSFSKHYTDCIELALKHRIPVYFLIMNDFISTYPMKLISSYTGGYVYFKSDYESNFSLKSLLTEIELSDKVHYEVNAPLLSAYERTKIININLNLIMGDEKISDKTHYFASEIKLPNERKIIATFDEDDIRLKEDYAGLIFALGQILVDFPDRKIRIYGHSSKSENIFISESISSKRASEIKEKLMNLGVKESQIELSDAGTTKPLYSFEQNDRQKEMNRRVEFKWIEPSTLPYEIIAQKTNSEYSAIKFTEEWEKQGFRSYFERDESLSEPIYKVKIWGFPTKQEAEKAIQRLNQKFSLVFDIE